MAQLHPFHKLCLVPADQEGKETLLLAAASDTIQVVSLLSGKLLSQWPSELGEEVDETSDDSDSGEPSKKRRKVGNGEPHPLSRQESEASETSIEILADGRLRQKGERRKPKIPDTRLPNVSHIISTLDGKHVITITAEDKAIRVFHVRKDGKLKQASARSLPKRLCAITLSKDGQTILAADKFGDVFSLPLHPSKDFKPRESIQNPDPPFKPAASKLTVHTKGNLEALRQQELQKHVQPRKEGPDFEHKQLLGHVSLLTDLVVAEGTIDGRPRPFILTADRDEHIRVSRGVPQAHVIETFCMGHREFVSKLCVLPWESKILIAGNGEPSLRIFDWQQGKELSVLHLVEVLRSELERVLNLHSRSLTRLAVSGIWPFLSGKERLILVGLEGIPRLFTFVVEGSDLEYIDSLPLAGNILDLVVIPDQQSIILSIDNVHESGSLKTLRTEKLCINSVQRYMLQTEEIDRSAPRNGSRLSWVEEAISFQFEPVLKELPQPNEDAGNESAKKGKVLGKTYSMVGELIYGLENLRKKRDRTFEEEDDETGPTVEAENEATTEI